MFESAAGVVRRVDVYAFDLTRELLFERFESKKVVAEDETIIEQVVIGHAVRRMIGLLRVFEQDARLKPRPVLLSNPGEFEFGFGCHVLNLP
jgi:hypothetical protein